MEFARPLLRLPIRFDAEALAAEVRSLGPDAWIPHPSGFAGNEAVPLITPYGQHSDEFLGPMEPTECLRRCPYIIQIMGELGAVWGRSRLMGLGPDAVVPPHIDIKYYWRTHTRIHVPIITNADVRFTCGGQTVHMAAGECWVLDTFQEHTVHNGGAEQRVHLVLDTTGGERLWELIDKAGQGGSDNEAALIEPGAPPKPLRFEQHQAPKIMSPWELRGHVDQLVGQSRPHPLLNDIRQRLDRLVSGWFGTWAQYADSEDGLPEYEAMLDSARRDLGAIGGSEVMLRNGLPLYRVLEVLLVGNAVAPEPVRKAIDDLQLQRATQRRVVQPVT